MGPRFYFEILDDALAIADRVLGKFVLLNATAGVIWLKLIEESTSIKVLAETFSNLPSLAQGYSAEEIVTTQLEEWTSWGWLQQTGDGFYQLNNEISVRIPNRQCDHLVPRTDWGRDGASIRSESTVCLGQQTLRLEMWSSSPIEECTFLARWSGMLSGLPSSTAPPQGTFACWEHGMDCLLDCNGSLYATSDSASASAILFDAILRFAYPSTISPITIHAAAVSNARGTILMPALSGSGKSTFTATLITKGWLYGGDDIVGVGRDPSNSGELQVIPFPTALGLKQGSWKLLSSDFPQFQWATEVTYNQKRVRFLPVSNEVHIPDSAHHRRLVALVVPCYDPSIQCHLARLSCSEALAAMVEAGVGPGNFIHTESIATLIEIARSVPAFRLRFSNLAEAERCLDALS